MESRLPYLGRTKKCTFSVFMAMTTRWRCTVIDWRTIVPVSSPPNRASALIFPWFCFCTHSLRKGKITIENKASLVFGFCSKRRKAISAISYTNSIIAVLWKLSTLTPHALVLFRYLNHLHNHILRQQLTVTVDTHSWKVMLVVSLVCTLRKSISIYLVTS